MPVVDTAVPWHATPVPVPLVRMLGYALAHAARSHTSLRSCPVMCRCPGVATPAARRWLVVTVAARFLVTRARVSRVGRSYPQRAGAVRPKRRGNAATRHSCVTRSAQPCGIVGGIRASASAVWDPLRPATAAAAAAVVEAVVLVLEQLPLLQLQTMRMMHRKLIVHHVVKCVVASLRAVCTAAVRYAMRVRVSRVQCG